MRRTWRLRFREVDEDVEEGEEIPFPRSGELEVAHGDGGGG
jgi:hypothetical protein